MNQKKAKGLKRLARKIIAAKEGQSWEIYWQYKKLKTAYKESKGQI